MSGRAEALRNLVFGMPDGVTMNVHVKIDAGHLAMLRPDQLEAFMKGLAAILSASESIKRSVEYALEQQSGPLAPPPGG